MLNEYDLVLDMAIALGAALAGGLTARFLRQSAVVGYLLAGIAVGPHALNIIGESDEIRVMATIGVIMLLFTLGAKFSLRDLVRTKRVAVGGGLFQLTATTGLGIGIATLLGLSLNEAIVFGFLIALSSTMVVIGLLTERGELDSVHGRVMIGILLVQDIAAAFMMFIVPALNGSGESGVAATLGLAILKAGVFIIVLLLLGTWVVPRLIRRVALRGSREMLILVSAALCFGGAFSAHQAGLSAGLGAFAVGLIIGESEFAHHVLGEMIPIRDIFAALFFVSVGMLVDLSFMADNVGAIVVVVLTIVLGKLLILSMITQALGYGGKTVLLVGAGMIQIGEFSIVLAELGLNSGVITQDLYSLTLASAIISILITPIIYSLTGIASKRLISAIGPSKSVNMPDPVNRIGKLSNHVVICGYGDVGSTVTWMLQQMEVAVLVIDLDPVAISDFSDQGIPCIYGDSANPEVLSKAQLKDASLLIITVSDPITARLTLVHALRINPDIDVVARVHSDFELRFLRGRGASELVQPEFETSLELVRHAMCRLGLGEERIQEFLGGFRKTCPIRIADAIDRNKGLGKIQY